MPYCSLKTFFIISICILNLTQLSLFANEADTKKDLYFYHYDEPYPYSICHEKKFIWFRNPKVASSTIDKALKSRHNPIKCELHIPWKEKPYQDYFRFAFIRNPWDRIVSAYFNNIIDHPEREKPFFDECIGKGFEYFIDFIARQDPKTTHLHLRPQSCILPVAELDYIGRFENFAEDYIEVMNILGFNDVVIEKRNSSTHNHYTTYYNERTKEIIAQIYEPDIEAFGYEFGD